MRSSFNLTLKKLRENGTDASGLGLQLGFEYGPMTVTRTWHERRRIGALLRSAGVCAWRRTRALPMYRQ